MIEEHITQEGDTVDLIAFNRFGVHGMEAAILDANPGLADRGPALPIGLVVRIPVPLKADRREVVDIWKAT